MSASWGLIRFNRTGNIYMCCYEGTSDILNPFFCTPKECYDEKLDCYCSVPYCRDLARGRPWAFPDNIDDLDEIEIYSDYGSGFYWAGTGSETARMVKTGIDTFEENVKVFYGKPDWVDAFEKGL